MGFALFSITSHNNHVKTFFFFTVGRTIWKHWLNCTGKTWRKQFDNIYILIISTRRAATCSATSDSSQLAPQGASGSTCDCIVSKRPFQYADTKYSYLQNLSNKQTNKKNIIQPPLSQDRPLVWVYLLHVFMSLCPIKAIPGTASLWRWRSPPERSSGTRRWACRLGFPSSTSTWCCKAPLDSCPASASCSSSPGSGLPLGWTYLNNR